MKPAPAWLAPFIGIPFVDLGRGYHGADCWGLVYLILRDHFRTEVPKYDAGYFNAMDADAIARLMDARRNGEWIEVGEDDVRPGDVVLIDIAARPVHVGLIFAPGRMVHSIKGMDSVQDEYTNRIWRNRVHGFFRPVGLA